MNNSQFGALLLCGICLGPFIAGMITTLFFTRIKHRIGLMIRRIVDDLGA